MSNKRCSSNDEESKDIDDLNDLKEIEEGAGCTEIWEKLTEHRLEECD